VGAMLVLTLLVTRYLLPHGYGKIRVIVATTGGTVVLLVVAFHGASVVYIWALLQWLRPAYVLVLLVLLLVLLAGPCASVAGKLYQEAALLMQSKDRARKALTLPGTRLLSNLFSRRRSLTGALFTR